MSLTPQEEAMHLEIKILLMFEAKTDEEKYIYKNALDTFFEQHTKYILTTLDQHLNAKAKQ